MSSTGQGLSIPRALRRAIGTMARVLHVRAIGLTRSYAPPELEAALRRSGLADGDAIMMHSAFRITNGFSGEPQNVIDCILDIIGPRGHLFMMSMPYTRTAREYLAKGTTFDVRRTPSQMGLISESFRRRAGVLRSANPMHPVLAWGPRAEWVVEGHESLPRSCGPGSPFEKILELDAKALLFDVDLASLTFTHFIEDAFRDTTPVPVYESEAVEAVIVDRGGARRTVQVLPYAPEARRHRQFSVLYDDVLRRDVVRQQHVGNTTLKLVPLREVLRSATELHGRGVHIYSRKEQSPRSHASPIPAVRGVALDLASGRMWSDLTAVLSRASSSGVHALRTLRLPSEARQAAARDHLGPPDRPVNAEAAVRATTAWLCAAQDRSTTQDGGVSHSYSLLGGWSSSYPETTGYIVPTLLSLADRTRDDALRERARRMLDWLLAIQLPDGAFQGGRVDARPVHAVTFNTGQILIGLAAGAAAFDDERYVRAMRRAADWLCETQHPEGNWPSHPSPFAGIGDKVYDTHVAWGLFEAARVSHEGRYLEAGMRNVRWALSHQRANGWFGRCCLTQPSQPLTHTIGYALRGVIEGYRISGEPGALEAARRTADALLRALGPDGHLPGRLRSDWSAAAPWTCLTGTSQIAVCWFLLGAHTGERKYADAARRANAYVRRTIALDGPEGLRGGVRGSFPVDGGYGTFRMLNWAAKFTIDAQLMELGLPQEHGP